MHQWHGRREKGSCIGRTQGKTCRVNVFVMPRSEIWTLKKPKPVSKRLKSVFHAPDLSTVLRMCRGEESQDRRVDVGLLWCQRLNWGAGTVSERG